MEKFVAGLVTAVVVAPVCALCVLGPAVLASGVGFVFAWLGGFSPVLTTGIAIVMTFLVLGVVKNRSRKRAGMNE